MAQQRSLTNHFLPALQWLDRLLERAMTRAPGLFGANSASDPYHGLIIAAEDVARLLGHPPLQPAFRAEFLGVHRVPENLQDLALVGPKGSRLDDLALAFNLTLFE